MTPQEEQMIDGLIQRINGTQVQDKDPEAEQHLQQGLGHNPNALYVLAQTVLVQSYALEQARKQLADAKQSLAQAQQQQQQPQKHTSFLGSIFGSDDKPAPPPQSQYAPVPTYSQPQSYGQPYAQPQSYYPPPSYGAPPPQGGGFLRGAAQTAAGVAAGALAFEGVESLMHGFGGHGGGLGFFGGGGGDAPREEVINNYYGDDAGRGHETRGFDGNNDIEDRRDDAASQSDFADTGDQDTGDDSGSSTDDFTSSDDDSSFDSGSDDSNFS